jgi:hypothetical protein
MVIITAAKRIIMGMTRNIMDMGIIMGTGITTTIAAQVSMLLLS